MVRALVDTERDTAFFAQAICALLSGLLALVQLLGLSFAAGAVATGLARRMAIFRAEVPVMTAITLIRDHASATVELCVICGLLGCGLILIGF